MSDQSLMKRTVLLDGKGGSREVPWDGSIPELREGEIPWLHLDRKDDEIKRWVRKDAGLDRLTSEALIAEETRPRLTRKGDGLLVMLRGVNLNPGADPEDMISIRLWIDAQRIISLRAHHVMAAADIRSHLAKGEGPKGSGDFIVALARGLMERMAPVLSDLEDAIDEMEEETLTQPAGEIRTKLSGLRRNAVALRRYLSPQREALERLKVEQVPWLSDFHREQLQEVSDILTRHLELLDSARDHAAVAQDELSNILAEQMNQRMYGLSLVALIFLPLGFLTGLLGINVGGMPGTDSNIAFWIVCLLSLITAGILVGVLKHKKWF